MIITCYLTRKASEIRIPSWSPRHEASEEADVLGLG